MGMEGVEGVEVGGASAARPCKPRGSLCVLDFCSLAGGGAGLGETEAGGNQDPSPFHPLWKLLEPLLVFCFWKEFVSLSVARDPEF